MRFSTRASLFFRFRMAFLALAFAGLGTGCQSAKSTFSFQPAPGAVHQAQTITMAPTATVLEAAPEAAGPAKTPQGKPGPRLQKRVRPHGQLQPRRLAMVEALRRSVRPAPALRRHLVARHRPAAESGLGLTVLGLLAMVTLVVALIGLLISGGGLVWAAIAVVAALVVLLAYLDPKGS